MELKDYQTKTLDVLSSFLDSLKKEKVNKFDYYEFQLSKNKEATHPEKSDYCNLAWQEIKAKFPITSGDYKSRFDGLERNIPNICFKIPTGGGKTLLASSAIQRINQDYFLRNTGFVLWVVPSETIYTQTSKNLRNKEHPYRQILDKASGGRTIILEKNDRFGKRDVEDNLCVMLLMLQSSNRESKEALKIFKDSGKFESFFPALDDFNSNKEFLESIPNLETLGLADVEADVIQGISIKHSLGNVLRILRPIVIIDEGHRATSALALNTINSFNPSFILELSATPKNSNVLIDVAGSDLKKEQMIKLPINVASNGKEGGWQQTINHAHKKLLELSKNSIDLQNNEGKYIRPIMLIKAEPKKKNDSHDQVEDIKKYLIDNLGASESEIRIKLSEKDEIKDEDLFDKLCPVKYIITKDALKEGWDCSFAYILAILTNSKSKTALTQFIGRVLRQPYAIQTSIESLNQCYVYCYDSDVNDAAEGIKKGLEDEGMGDVGDQIRIEQNKNIDEGIEKMILKRNEKFKEKIFLPQLSVFKKEEPRKFDYYRDILEEIKWENYSFDSSNLIINKSTADSDIAKIDLKNRENQLDLQIIDRKTISEKIIQKPDIGLMTSQLMDKVPNAWYAAKIIQKTIDDLKERNIDESLINLNSVYIVDEIKRDVFVWILQESENLFASKLSEGKIFLRLLAEPFASLNWQMLDEISVYKKSTDLDLHLDKNIFQPQPSSLYNDLERKVAIAINKIEAVKWWHRLGVKGTEYFVQGWKKDKIYPDFLVKFDSVDNIPKIQFIETKGNHLDNPDSNYKRKVFDYLTKFANEEVKSAGEIKFVNSSEKLTFDMIFEDNWESSLKEIIK